MPCAVRRRTTLRRHHAFLRSTPWSDASHQGQYLGKDERVRACKLRRVARRSVIRKRTPHAPIWENAGKDHHRRCSPLGIKIRRARGKDRDISEVLRAEHRPEPLSHWGTRCPGNVEVVLFLSLHIRPRVEGDASVFRLVLLDIAFHGLSSPLLWPLTSALIEPTLATTRDCTCAHTL